MCHASSVAGMVWSLQAWLHHELVELWNGTLRFTFFAYLSLLHCFRLTFALLSFHFIDLFFESSTPKYCFSCQFEPSLQRELQFCAHVHTSPLFLPMVRLVARID
jgi:hypothetical protein